MKRPLALITLALASAAMAQDIAWINEPGGVAVASDAADNVFTARWDYNPAGDILVAKRNPTGRVLWESRFDNVDSTRHEMATFVAADSAGNVLVSGTIRSGFANPVNAASVLMKFSPDGQLLWRRVYSSDFDGSSTRRVVLDRQDRAHVLGLGLCPLGMVGTVRQFNADGSAGWTWCDSIGIGSPTMLKRTPDDQFVIAARSIFGSLQGFARIDASGQTVWSMAGIPSLTVGDIAGDVLGNSYLVSADPTTGQGTRLRKVSPTGATLWERSHPMSAFRVEVGPDGAPVLSGFPNSGSGGAAFAKFSASGELLWTNPDASGVGLLLHSQMLIDATGAAYLSGSTLVEMGVAKVNANGSTAWAQRLPGGSTAGIALGSAHQLYVAGGIYTARLDPAPVPTIDLNLVLADAPDPMRVGATLAYTATVRNLGNATAAGVAYVQPLPRTVTWLSATPSQGSCTGGRTVSCSLGTLAPGASASVTVLVSPLRRGTLAANASVTTTSVDADPGNNTATTVTTVNR